MDLNLIRSLTASEQEKAGSPPSSAKPSPEPSTGKHSLEQQIGLTGYTTQELELLDQSLTEADLRLLRGLQLEGIHVPADLAAVVALADAEPFRFPDPLWVRVVYGFAAAYSRARLPREQLLRSLVPLYLGRTASFVLEADGSGADEVEQLIRALADEFVAQKPYLRERWRDS